MMEGGIYLPSIKIMSEKFLSILIPSNRPEGLDLYIESLRKNAIKFDDIEIVVLVDSDKNYVTYNNGIVTRYYKRTEPLNVSELQYECYKISCGKWIMLSNDDVIMETYGWDKVIRDATGAYKDEAVLIYPNDNMFGKALACFPIISRKVIEATKLFPLPYRRYKVDDTIFYMFPPERRIYLEHVKMTHLNDHGESGYKLPDGRIYPIDHNAGRHDEELWHINASKRQQYASIIGNMIGVGGETKVMIGIPTQEMARRADFYDYLSLLEKPIGTIQSASHGQSPAQNRNLIIDQALTHNCTHVMFIDDDMVFTPDLLKRLLAHDVDMVTAFYMMRNFPHQPVLFDQHNTDDGSCGYYFPEDSDTGLKQIVNCGLGACLIKTEVFRAMERPWITLGELTKDMWCDDISFFNRALAKGFKLYVDLDLTVGHMAQLTVHPTRIDNKWCIAYDTHGTSRASFVMPRPVMAEKEKV